MTAASARFVIGEHDFLLDGEPFRVLSGALHYFRVHPDLWADRIDKARMLGLNTIETYVPWNLHERRRGTWRADGGLDLGRFLDLVQAAGMRAIVRPGPYICAELDNGGLPAWLFADPEIGIRRAEPRYLAAVGEYLANVHEIVRGRQIDAGGPVILMQVENEYGAYGADADYLDELVRMVRGDGIIVPLTTVDQPQPQMLAAGSRPGLLRTGSFGSDSLRRLAVLREAQPTGPLMCSEYWDGWFDSWGAHHHTTSAEDAAADLDALLAAGASVNLYMFHGGTNFGLTSGANDKGVFRPIVTSYDYDAPLDEAGDPTPKYWAFREVIARYAPVPGERPPAARPAPAGEVELHALAGTLDALETHTPGVPTDDVPTFAELGHDAGLVLHLASAASPAAAVLAVGEVRDRLHVFADSRPVGVLAREEHATALTIPPISSRLQLLVENEGRVDYGPRLGEDKGIIGGVRIDGEPVTGWTSHALAPEDLVAVAERLEPDPARPPGLAGPTFARGRFDVDEPVDRFLDLSDLGRGIVWINGFCLGRYSSRGPQRTLYVPGPVLRAGGNDILVLELRAAAIARARFVASAELGWLEE